MRRDDGSVLACIAYEFQPFHGLTCATGNWTRQVENIGSPIRTTGILGIPSTAVDLALAALVATRCGVRLRHRRHKPYQTDTKTDCLRGSL